MDDSRYNEKLAKAKLVQSQINNKKRPSYITVIENIETWVMVSVEEDEDE